MPEDIKDEKEKIKWLIENRLGANMTLEEYVKYLEEQEQEVVDNYIRKVKRRKLNEDKIK